MTGKKMPPSNAPLDDLLRLFETGAIKDYDLEVVGRMMRTHFDEAETYAFRVDELEEQIAGLLNPEIRKAVVYKDGKRYFMLWGGSLDDEDWIKKAADDGYDDRPPLIWASQFTNQHEVELAMSAHPNAVYREIDVWGNLITEKVVETPTELPVKPTARQRTRTRTRVRVRNGTK